MKAFLKDNRGVTLVELLIATIVLALITIPLLNSFKTSTRTAVKSEQLGRVSMAAQNILERIEAADVSKLTSYATTARDALQAAAATYYGKNGDTYVSLADRNNDKHCIWLQGISSGISSYNAMVEIEPYDDINDKELSVVTPIQLVFSQTDDDPDNIVSRDIVLEVERNGANVTANISYSYEKSLVAPADVDPVETEEEKDEGETGGTGGTGELDDDEENKTESESGGDYTGTINVPAGEAFSIHMLYTPVFDVEDNITIETNDLDFDLFLVKKLRNPDNKDYKCTINLLGAPIDIYTNVYDSMGEGFSDGNIIITYNINGEPAPAENGLKNSLVLTQTKDRAHKITVKVYAADADFTAEPLTELKGITLD